MFNLIPVPAFADNYLWLLHDGKKALVVDPGDEQPILEVLAGLKLVLAAILVTHHHADHTGGVAALRQKTGAVVYGPAGEVIPEPYLPLAQGDSIEALGVQFGVIDVPGHTAGHIAYFAASLSLAGQTQPLLFCGDTLFSGGCGRLFEGTPGQMLTSLDKLAALPANTVVCCTHEYTLSNLRFARAVDPDNEALERYQTACIALREQGVPTLPSSIERELAINPFLRSRTPAVMRSARQFDPAANDEISDFAALRQWKNTFQ